MAVRKTEKGASLQRWFKEKWTDQDGNPCGSKEGDKVKKCRPSKRVSPKTPVSWSQIGLNKKKKLVAEKKRVGMGKKTKNL